MVTPPSDFASGATPGFRQLDAQSRKKASGKILIYRWSEAKGAAVLCPFRFGKKRRRKNRRRKSKSATQGSPLQDTGAYNDAVHRRAE
jgi:hypothetical protein